MKRLCWILFVLILAGCEAQSTPIAALITATATLQATTVPLPQLRYAVAANLVPYVDDLQATIHFEVYEAGIALSDYDLVVAYGVYDGWQQAPISHRVSLAINPNLAPFDNLNIRNLIAQIIDVQAIIENLNIPNTQQTSALEAESSSLIRTALANAGYPDGFQLTLATELVPALDSLVGQFSQVSLNLQLIEVTDSVLSDNQAQMVLFLWAQESERAAWSAQVGADNILDLWTMPISYVAREGLAVEFNENGLPIPAQ